MTQEFSKPVFALRDATACRSAQLLDFKLHHPKRKQSHAQRAGIRYEKKTLKHLSLELPEPVMYHPAFRFNAGTPYDEHAIPDAIYLHEGTLTIFEIKLKHTADAWFQLNKLYKPILARAYPGARINLCEICRDYDPSIRLPGRIEKLDTLDAFVSTPQDAYGIYLYSGRI